MSTEQTEQIMVNLPQYLVNELDALLDEEANRDDAIHRAAKMYVQEKKKQQIRKTMENGYVEMAKINLNIATESFLAEEEAESTLDRLVSGV
ncbi:MULTISPECIES: antitoxin [Bacillati]|uniref:CopG family transcriptional regulator / antitoxin EndoAI n=1 Tax=Salisediminibacterium halotolerans TaxID=517425 RepID=A0A1H9SPI6_9BACI|nr:MULTISPECIES: antitoxin [Salisediminibacterium]RLJ73296.1 CopG family transcriptional regulator/antitoxin EndoAI [Actinophytocola xinjiangensis]RPE86718.1 CopG family transcriptional regulator/antitoxin EndoAI [Salisediminibacterium halotolerans]TWG34093.1 CopG family transcriptional regulator/antitoxin EndoAI [Salisediminibacterium halotolerans]SER86794.1 CopG family transcriptional regulator / antitoxin EndoAI [Salisediminibacterium haloalkalitolerans]GEL07607.1 antitoxin EndoAI [Salisedi